MSPLFISVVAFVAITALVAAIMFIVRDFSATKVEDRLQVLSGLKTPELDSRKLIRDTIVRDGFDGASNFFSGLLAKVTNLNMLLEQADAPFKADAFLGISLGLGVVGGAIAIIARSPLPVVPVVVLVFMAMPMAYILWLRSRRFGKFAKQLPDALELIGRALRSGHSLASGMHVVVEEMPAPISVEFAMVYEEQNLGVPLEQALKGMLKRMPNLDLKFFVTAVAIQRQAGGDLSEILDKIGYIIRERFKILGQVQALTGEGRISGIVLMALPIALFFAVFHLNPPYVMLLFEDELGRKMIAVAAFLQVLGAICIKKIVNIKV